MILGRIFKLIFLDKSIISKKYVYKTQLLKCKSLTEKMRVAKQDYS